MTAVIPPGAAHFDHAGTTYYVWVLDVNGDVAEAVCKGWPYRLRCEPPFAPPYPEPKSLTLYPDTDPYALLGGNGNFVALTDGWQNPDATELHVSMGDHPQAPVLIVPFTDVAPVIALPVVGDGPVYVLTGRRWVTAEVAVWDGDSWQPTVIRRWDEPTQAWVPSFVVTGVAAAGANGEHKFIPADAPPPADFFALVALGHLGLLPEDEFAEGEYVLLGDGSKAHFDGDAWEPGAKPPIPPTGLVAGAGGVWTFTPALASVPVDLAALVALGALGQTTAWAPGEYVLLRDGSKAHWTGTAWAAGAVPTGPILPTGLAAGAGGEWTFTPVGCEVPADLAALRALGALGQSAVWAEAEFVTLGDASLAHWDGDSWEAGAVPPPGPAGTYLGRYTVISPFQQPMPLGRAALHPAGNGFWAGVTDLDGLNTYALAETLDNGFNQTGMFGTFVVAWSGGTYEISPNGSSLSPGYYWGWIGTTVGAWPPAGTEVTITWTP